MDVAIIIDGVVQNVIVVRDVAHAQSLFPGTQCFERKPNIMLEPGAAIVGKAVIRAADVDDTVKLQAKSALVVLDK